MKLATVVLTSAISLILLGMSLICPVVNADDSGHPEHNIIVPPPKFAGPDDKKIWEGEINGRHVACFSVKKAGGEDHVVIVTRDELPSYFKRIEYLDKGGDGSLDMLRMRIYEIAKGWRRVGITRDNKYGLAYADSQFRELLEKIRDARDAKK